MTEQLAKTGTPSHEPGRADPAVTTGDSAVFSSLIEPYRRELHLHCYRLLGSLQDAEDLVQETMLRAWQHFDTFKGHASLRTWLYTIATNACLDTLKKRPPRTLTAAASPPMNPLTPIAQAPAESICLEPCFGGGKRFALFSLPQPLDLRRRVNGICMRRVPMHSRHLSSIEPTNLTAPIGPSVFKSSPSRVRQRPGTSPILRPLQSHHSSPLSASPSN